LQAAVTVARAIEIAPSQDRPRASAIHRPVAVAAP